MNGRPVEISGPRDALALGIRIIYQELNLVSGISVAENIFLGALPTRGLGIVDRRALAADASRLLADLGITPTSAEAVISSYLWRYRAKGEYAQSQARREIPAP